MPRGVPRVGRWVPWVPGGPLVPVQWCQVGPSTSTVVPGRPSQAQLEDTQPGSARDTQPGSVREGLIGRTAL